MPVRPTIAALSLVTFLGAGVSRAQETEAASQPDPSAPAAPDAAPLVREDDGVGFTIAARSRLAFRSDIRDSDADVQALHTRLGFSVDAPLGDRFRIGGGIGGELAWYDLGNPRSFMPGASEGFEDLYSTDISIRGTWLATDTWSFTGLAFARAQGESDAEFEDMLTGGGIAIATCSFSKDLRLGFGVGITSRLEDNPLVIPYLAVAWRINERTRLETQGLTIAILADLDEARQWEAGLRGGYEFRDYRLDDSRPAFRNGIVTDERVPIGVELTWKPIGGLRLTLEGGAIVYQRFEFLSSGGVEREDFETDPTPFIGLSLEYRF